MMHLFRLFCHFEIPSVKPSRGTKQPIRYLGIPITLAYMMHLYFKMGDSMAFVHIERPWGKADISNPVRVLWNSLVLLWGAKKTHGLQFTVPHAFTNASKAKMWTALFFTCRCGEYGGFIVPGCFFAGNGGQSL